MYGFSVIGIEFSKIEKFFFVFIFDVGLQGIINSYERPPTCILIVYLCIISIALVSHEKKF